MMTTAEIILRLDSPDARVRQEVCQALYGYPPSDDLVARLVERLADDGWWEQDSEPGAPPFVYGVADAAESTLVRWGLSARSSLPRLLALIEAGNVRAANVACGIDDAAVDEVGKHLQVPQMLAAFGRGLRSTNLAHTARFCAVLRALLTPDGNLSFEACKVLQVCGNRWPQPPALAQAQAIVLAESPHAVRALEASTSDLMERFRAINALAQFVGNQEAAEVLARRFLSTDSPRDGHRLAAEALLNVGPVLPDGLLCQLTALAEALPPVLAAYGPRARFAMDALVAVLGRGPADPSWATKQQNLKLREQASWALSAIEPRGGAWRAELIRIWADGDAHASALAQRVLGPLSENEAVPVLLERLRGPDPARAMVALRSFGAGATPAVPLLRAWLGPATPNVLVDPAILLLEAIGAASSAVLPELISLLDTHHQAGVLRVIAAIGPAARPQTETILEVLRAEFARPDLVDSALRAIRGV